MGKISKIVVCGHTGVGKTAAIEQLIFGNHVIGTVSHSGNRYLLHITGNVTEYGVID